MDTLFPSSTLFRSRYRPARLARRAAGRGRRPPRRPRADRRALPRDAHAAARMSLDARIRADIEARIRSGAWPPGHRIPFEHELTATYGCSRATVSKALGALARAGIIDRRKRAECDAPAATPIGRAHVCTPVPNSHLLCRLLLDKKKQLTLI